MSGLFGATTIPGNRLTDIAQQTSSVGQPIPFGYGRFLVDGNIIWSAGKPVEHVTKKKQGKGGVKTQEFTYTLSYAIGFCAGPIYGYFTILRDGKVVFTTDPNALIEDKAFAAKWAQKCTMYFGTATQMPDSTIEAVKGAGKVSAFRDLAYIVVEEDDVTSNGGAIPQYAAVVIATPPDVYITSRPYPVEMRDDMRGSVGALSVRLQPQPTVQDSMSAVVVPLEIDLYGGQKVYVAPNEDALQSSVLPLEIDLYGGQKLYDFVESDQLVATVAPLEIDLYGGAQSYDIPYDSLQVSVAPLSIILETV